MSNQSIEVRLFAGAAAVAQRDHLIVPWNSQGQTNPTAAELMESIGNVCTPLADWIASCRLAVDGQFVLATTPIPLDAEVALIPPVSGG